MKKLTIIILTIGTILLSGCGAKQNQVSSENKSLSGKKVAVSSLEKVKNLTKHDNLGNNTKQEKQVVKTDKKQDNEVGTVKTLVENTEENKPKQNEATEQNETDDTEVEVEYKVKELLDYNHCFMKKKNFENIKNKYIGITDDIEYEDLCLPKYKLIGTIKRGDPDKITVESCHDGKPYTLKNFKKGDKKFEYNIAYGYGNVCSESNLDYKFNFYRNGKKNIIVNGKNITDYIESFDYLKKQYGYLFKNEQGIEICKNSNDICYERMDDSEIRIIRYEGSRFSEPDIILDNKGNIYTDYGNDITIKGYYDSWDSICGADKDGYLIIGGEPIRLQDLSLNGYSVCGDIYEISENNFKKLGSKKEILITKKNINVLDFLQQNTNAGYRGIFCSNKFKGDNLKNNIKKVKFFKDEYTGNYSYLFYDKYGNVIPISYCDGVDGSSKSIYVTFVNGKGIFIK